MLANRAIDSQRLSEIDLCCFPCGCNSQQYFKQTRDPILITKDANGVIIGYLHLRVSKGSTPKSLWIHTLAVHPNHRRQNIGTQLIVDAESYAKRHGYKCLYLSVLEDNLPARTLYEKSGFIYPDEMNKTCMKKHINS